MTVKRTSALLALTLLVLSDCDSNQQLHSPTIRVDLSARLPEKASRRAVSGITYYCRKGVSLSQGAAKQDFIVSWRIIDIDKIRYIVAAEVAPKGKTVGAKNPKASATVGAANPLDQNLPLRIYWGAQSGCSTLEATMDTKLSLNDPSCRLAEP